MLPIRERLKLASRWFTLKIKAGPLAGMNWIAWCGKRFLKGEYEPSKTDAVLESVGSGETTYDIGGHVGYYALIQAKQVGPTGQVICFEPRPINIAYIKRHIKINHVKNVRLIESAVSDAVGTAQFNSRVGTGTGHLADDGNLAVATTAIDTLVSDQQIPLPDFIKIDVEGGEIAAIEGAKKTITQHRPKLLVATHGDDEHAYVLNFLEHQNYQYRILNETATKGDTEILAWPA